MSKFLYRSLQHHTDEAEGADDSLQDDIEHDTEGDSYSTNDKHNKVIWGLSFNLSICMMVGKKRLQNNALLLDTSFCYNYLFLFSIIASTKKERVDIRVYIIFVAKVFKR